MTDEEISPELVQLVRSVLSNLVKFSDDSFDSKMSVACADFLATDHTPYEHAFFLRNLLDMCVFGALASDSIIRVIAVVVSRLPKESEQELSDRRKVLELFEDGKLESFLKEQR